MRTYNAIHVAKFIITHALRSRKPVTPIKLYEILYLLFVEVYARYSISLIDERFIARPFGPRVQSVYNRFCLFGGFPIDIEYDASIGDDDEKELMEIIDHYIDLDSRQLVALVCKPGMAWDITYHSGAGSRRAISIETIAQHDCKEIK